jgi:protein-S-isoprenylcysteine O-methyltransferase Ste14
MGITLLTFQVLIFLIQFLFSHLFNIFTTPFLTFLIFLGLFLFFWSIKTLGLRSYSPLPVPRVGNILQVKGPYKYMRHPVYSGLFLLSIAFFVSRATMITAIFFSLFIIITDFKANYEERLMTEKHKSYLKYKRSTKKYIPHVL